MDKSKSAITTALLAVFITLKVTKVIDWSWWWVLSPLWIPIAIVIILAIVVGLAESFNRQ